MIDLQMLTPSWHMTHGMRYVSTNGFKGLFAQAGPFDIECIFDAIEGRVTIDPVDVIGQCKNICFIFLDIEFVFDFTHDFF